VPVTSISKRVRPNGSTTRVGCEGDPRKGPGDIAGHQHLARAQCPARALRSPEMPKAWIVYELGTPEQLRFEDVEPTQSTEGLVRIRVRAAGVNFFDLLQIGGTYQVKPDLPFVPGAEVGGEVEVAPPESGFEAGDRVLAVVSQEGLHRGGYTEVTHADPDAVVKIPDAMSYEEGAAFFINYQTGWFGLHRRACLQADDVVLVHAGAGGVGSAAIQLGLSRLRARKPSLRSVAQWAPIWRSTTTRTTSSL